MNSFLAWAIFLITGILAQTSNLRTIEYEGKSYQTTFNVLKFNGTYRGNKEGYLEIRPDGTGTYTYDIFGLAPATCKKGPIEFEYGFLVDEKGDIVKLEREYGFSYPLLLRSTGETSFQGCRTPVLLDFLLEYEDGSVEVSSSDDWVRQE